MSDLLPLGIHLGLPEEPYHADPGLGSGSLRQLATRPCQWQYDRLRKAEEDEREAPHLLWGRAWHCRVLEGKDAYDLRYADPPRRSDYPNALATVDEIKEFLRQYGQKLNGNKPELMARARDLDDCPPFFDEILARWHFDHPDHVGLKPGMAREIEDAVSNMERDPTLSAVMTAGSLIDGAAEVSIIWNDERGVRRKCRLDYVLAPTPARTKSLVVDLKSFQTFKGHSDEEAAIRKVYDEFYDVQGAAYKDGYIAGLQLLKQGLVFGKPPAPGYLESFFNAPGLDWVWVFLRKDNGMVPVVLSADMEDEMFADAAMIVDAAISNYVAYSALWGHDQLWTPPAKTPLRINKSHLPSYNRGVLHEQPQPR